MRLWGFAAAATAAAALADAVVLQASMAGAKSLISLAIGLMVGLQKMAPATKVHDGVRSTAEHVAELR